MQNDHRNTYNVILAYEGQKVKQIIVQDFDQTYEDQEIKPAVNNDLYI